jgi:hypothetical protein
LAGARTEARRSGSSRSMWVAPCISPLPPSGTFSKALASVWGRLSVTPTRWRWRCDFPSTGRKTRGGRAGRGEKERKEGTQHAWRSDLSVFFFFCFALCFELDGLKRQRNESPRAPGSWARYCVQPFSHTACGSMSGRSPTPTVPVQIVHAPGPVESEERVPVGL